MWRQRVFRLCLLLAGVGMAPHGSAGIATGGGGGGFPRDVEQVEPQWHNRLDRQHAPLAVRQPHDPPFDSASPLVAAANAVEGALANWNGQLSGPVIVVVDMEPASLRYTQRIWGAVDAELHANATFRLLVYDANANNYRWHAEARGVDELRQALWAAGARADAQGAATFAALQRAADAAPFLRGAAGAGAGAGGYNVVLLFCGRPAADDASRARVAHALLTKRAKLYVWWTGGERFPGAEAPLRQTAEETGGELVYVSTKPATLPPVNFSPATPTSDPDVDAGDHAPCSTLGGQAILAARLGLTGRTTTQVPVDSGVDAIEVLVRGLFNEVEVQPPIGFAVKYKAGRRRPTPDWCVEDASDGAGAGLRRQFDTRSVGSGYWEVTVDDAGSSTVDEDSAAPRAEAYDVIVTGTSRLAVDDQASEKEWVDENEYKVFQISGASDINITGLSLRDTNGEELTQLSYKQRNETGNVADVAVPIETLSEFPRPYFLEVNGFNHTSGAKFVRLTPSFGSSRLEVKLSSNSTLNILSRRRTQILLDITNKGDKLSRVYVTASGSSVQVTLSKVTRLDLYPGRVNHIVVYLYAPEKTEDIINVYLQDETSLTKTTVQLRITASDSSVQQIDTSKPKVTHKVLNKCKTSSEDCSSRRWGVEVTVEDKQSGIRDITSQPPGIEWLSPVSIGVRVPVRVKYSATCCQEKVIMSVQDMQYNTAEYTIDITNDGGLDPGIIAAIVIGAVLLLVIIIVIIVVVVRKKRTHTFQTQQVPR